MSSNWVYPGQAVLNHTIRDLIHFLGDGPCPKLGASAFKETIGGNRPTSEIWYTGPDKAKKICAHTRVWGEGPRVVSETWTVYDMDGTTPLSSITDTISYVGSDEVYRTRTCTGY